MKRFGKFTYEVHFYGIGWGYVIGILPDKKIIESQDYFNTEHEAGFAAIGHITLLEKEKTGMFKYIRFWIKGHQFLMNYNPSYRCYHQSSNDRCSYCKKKRK